jgi:hypothetical protein
MRIGRSANRNLAVTRGGGRYGGGGMGMPGGGMGMPGIR